MNQITPNRSPSDPASDAPLVSIVVPTYNRARLLGETIESILAQDYRPLELIVVSDGSTDDTPNVVDAWSRRDPRVRLLSQANSGGPAHPRNSGVQAARGVYIAFCDDDDLWTPDKLRKQVALMERETDAALCFTGGATLGNGDRFSHRAIKKGVASGHFRRLLYGNFIANSSVLVRRRVLEQVGPFNTASALHGAEDYEMWVRIARHYRLVRLDEPLIKYRIHPDNLAGNRAKATRRGIVALRALRESSTITDSIVLPLLWMQLKYAVYALARR